MNKIIYLALAAAAFAGPSYATIEDECSENHAHAVYVCEYIYQARQSFSSFLPPAPMVVTSSELPADWPSVGANIPSFTAPEGETKTQENTGFTLF